MSATPFMQLYVGDYLADTIDLTTEQHGAYLLLLITMWRNDASLPNDPKKLARIARVHPPRWSKVWGAIEHFFDVSGDRITNKRLSKEHEKARHKSRSCAQNGSKGGAAKALKNNETHIANVSASPQHSQNTEVREKEEANASSKKRGSRLSADWALPKAWGEWAVSEEGLPEADVRREADKFRDYWTGVAGAKGVKLDWLATWRGWIRKAADDRRKSQARPTAQASTDIGAVRVRPDGARQVYMGNGVGWVVQHA